MSGIDYDYLVKNDFQWVLRRFMRHMRRRWPRLVCGVEREVYSRDGKLLDEYPDFFVVSRDVEMQEAARVQGLPNKEIGDFSFFVIHNPRMDGSVGVDVVVADPRPFGFTEIVLGFFSEAIFDWYRRRSMSTLRAKGWLRRGLLMTGVDADSEWMEQAVRSSVLRRWPEAKPVASEDGNVGRLGKQVRWTLGVPVQVQNGQAEVHTAVFFGAASDSEPHKSFVGVSFPGGTSRAWRKEVFDVLREAVAMWHVISFRSMKNPFLAYACPPGSPVLKDGEVEYEGTGGNYPDSLK